MSEELSRDCWLTNDEMRAMISGRFKFRGEMTAWARSVGINPGIASRAAGGMGPVPASVAREFGYRPITVFVPIEGRP